MRNKKLNIRVDIKEVTELPPAQEQSWNQYYDFLFHGVVVNKNNGGIK